MYNTSEAYKTAMEMPVLEPGILEVSFGLVDPTAKSDAELSDNDNIYWSDLSRVVYAIDQPYLYGTLEPGFFALDGLCIAAVLEGETPQIYQGYVSDSISDASGNFTANPIITIDFTDTHSINSLTLFFDEIDNEYCSSVKITFKQDSTIIDETTYTFTSYLAETDLEVEDFNQIIIEFIETSEPYRRVRLSQILFGVYKEWSTANGIIKAVQTQKNDPVTIRLPEADFTFTN